MSGFHHRATYTPEDNKLRFYPDWDDPAFDKEDMKAAGYRWASKQDCYVCPRWTVTAEDAALEHVDDIEDEDYSPQERSADRAERFGGYRDKRAGEAGGHADTFEEGPQAFGHQNAARAERQAKRHDRHRTRALSQWSKAEYWQERTAGVIRSALYKSRPDVRRSRIKRLEAEQRKHLRELECFVSKWEGWRKVATLPGAEIAEPEACKGNPALVKSFPGSLMLIHHERSDDPHELAYTLANWGWGGDYHHPRRAPDPEKYNDGKTSLYQLLTDEDDPISPAEAAALWLEGMHDDGPAREGGHADRWSNHYELRLGYERAMLGDEGGAASSVEIEPGGFFGSHQVHKVNKSNATGQVVSVMIKGSWGYTDVGGRQCYVDHANAQGLAKLDITRLPADAYRPPTDEEREAFKATQQAAKASKPKGPKLINPAAEDAAKLQAIWNDASTREGGEVCEMKQATYSHLSGGDAVHTVQCGPDGKPLGRRSDATPAFKVRARWTMYGVDRVVILTDKPQKALPIEEPKPSEAAQVWDALSTCGRELFLRRNSMALGWSSHTWAKLDRDAQSAFETQLNELPGAPEPEAREVEREYMETH